MKHCLLFKEYNSIQIIPTLSMMASNIYKWFVIEFWIREGERFLPKHRHMSIVLRCNNIYFDTAFTKLHCCNTFRYSNKCLMLQQCLGSMGQLVFYLSFLFKALLFHRYLTSSMGSDSMIWRIFCCHLFRILWAIRKAESWRINAFELWCWKRLLRVPWSARRSNQSTSRRSVLGVNWKDWCWSWGSNTLATSCEELTHWKRPWCWEILRAGGEGMTEDEMVGWHHRLNAHGFGWTLGFGDGQGGLACYSSWGHKEWTRLSNWTELTNPKGKKYI